MGTFHCPIGAVAYQSFGCIECGLCFASTRAEAAAATDIIRQYIRQNASHRADCKLKKIAVCGKGGSGKSTVAAMLAFAFCSLGYSPLVLDTDDSNAGLSRKLGISAVPTPLIACTEPFARENADSSWLMRDPLAIGDIPSTFIRAGNGIRFMQSGKIENPLQGCSCVISDVARLLAGNLQLGKGELLIVDNDAGIESFGRGAEQGMDTVLIIVEPSYESVELAGTIQYMSEGLGIRRVRAIINKVRDSAQDEEVKDMLAERGVRFLGSLSLDASLERSNLRGMPVSASPTQAEVERLVMLMLDEAELPYRKTEVKPENTQSKFTQPT